MNSPVSRCIATAMLLNFGLFPGELRAENEPDDDTTGGATPIEIGSPSTPSQPSTGNISDADKDYYQITNTVGFKKIRISYSFEGSGSDSTTLKILGPDGTDEIASRTAGPSDYAASYTINAETGASYFICIEGDSAVGTPDYSLYVSGTPDLNALTNINRQIAKLKRKLKKAKAKKHKRTTKKLSKAIKKKRKQKVRLLRA